MKIRVNIQNAKTALLVVVFAFVFITGCKKEDDDPAPVAPASTSINGSWTCSEVIKHQPATNPFTVHIINGTGDTILMENFYALGFDKKAKLKKTGDSLNFYYVPQSVSAGIGVSTGKGKFSSATSLTMHYLVND